MKCPACQHENLSDFPFCEQCLELLPALGAGRAGGFDLLEDGPSATAPMGSTWPPFPWNPRDLQNPLIGREKAVAALVAGFEEVRKGLHARIHLLVSAYGLGKSRVVGAMVKRARELEEDTRVVRTRCPNAGRPFRMWDGVIRATFAIPTDADPESAGAHLVQALEDDDIDEAKELATLIGALLGYQIPGVRASFDEDDEAVVGRGTAAISRALGAVAAKRTLLIVVENANAASRPSLTLASSLEATLRDRPVMLLLLGSPELEDILPRWDRMPVTSLKALSKAEADMILRLFLTGIEDVPKELGKRILKRGHGNPYAIKSMVRYLREAGAIRLHRKRWRIAEDVAWDLDMPEDLAGVVLAQYGMLSADDRAILGRAAVVGERFWLGALVAVARMDQDGGDELGATRRDKVPKRIRETLARFIERGFIEHSESMVAGVDAFTFRSTAHHQVARSLLPATARERVHGVVWQWLVLQLGDRGGEMLDRLAEHAEGAGERAHAARYLLQAAVQAGARVEPDEERRLFEAAESLVGDGDVATRLEIAMGLGDALVRSGDVEGALERYDQSLKLAWRMRMRSTGASALERIGRVERDRGHLKVAEEYMLQAMRLFEAVEDRSGVAGVCHDLGAVYWLRGDFDGALQLYRKAESIYRSLRDRVGLGHIIHAIGVIHLEQGDLAVSAEYLEDALDLRRRVGDPADISGTLNALGVVFASRGEREAAVASWSEALDHAERAGNMAWQAGVSNNLAEALIPMDRLEEARHYLDYAIERADVAEHPRIATDARRNLALLLAAQEEYEDASGVLDRARADAKRLGQPRLTASVDRTQGELAACLARAAEASETSGKTHWSKAEASWRKSATTFEKGGYTLEAAKTAALLADALYELGKVEEAEDQRRRAADLKARHATHEVAPS
jgi:tetratricopeptide (TPR) repeat protein